MVIYIRFLSLLEMMWSFIPDFFVCWRCCGRLYQISSSVGDDVVVYTRFLSLLEMVRSFIPDFLVCWRCCGRLYQIS